MVTAAAARGHVSQHDDKPGSAGGGILQWKKEISPLYCLDVIQGVTYFQISFLPFFFLGSFILEVICWEVLFKFLPKLI